jgi:hypothetical protein
MVEAVKPGEELHPGFCKLSGGTCLRARDRQAECLANSREKSHTSSFVEMRIS